MVPVLCVCVGALYPVGCFFCMHWYVRPMADVSDHMFSGDDGMDSKIFHSCPSLTVSQIVSKNVQTLTHDDRNVQTL